MRTRCAHGAQVLQKEATRTLSRFSLRPKVVREHLHSRPWVAGLALDLGGALLMVASYAMAPVGCGRVLAHDAPGTWSDTPGRRCRSCSPSRAWALASLPSSPTSIWA